DFVTRVFGFTGTDLNGQTWSRQVSVNFHPTVLFSDFNFAATPLVVSQNTSADPSCQWSVRLDADELGGFGNNSLNALTVGDVNMTSRVTSIFGTPRMAEYSGLSGTLCFGGITPPASNQIFIGRSDGAFNAVTVSFEGPTANPVKLT